MHIEDVEIEASHRPGLWVILVLCFVYASCSEALGIPAWLREGVFADYVTGRMVILRNGTYLESPLECPVECRPRLIFQVDRVEGDYAWLNVTMLFLNITRFHETTGREFVDKVSISRVVTVKLSTGEYVDEQGRPWGRNLLWIEPFDIAAEDMVVVRDYDGREIRGNITLPVGPPDRKKLVYTAFREFEYHRLARLVSVPVHHRYGAGLLLVYYDGESGLVVKGLFSPNDLLYHVFQVEAILIAAEYDKAADPMTLMLYDTNIVPRDNEAVTGENGESPSAGICSHISSCIYLYLLIILGSLVLLLCVLLRNRGGARMAQASKGKKG